MGRTSLALVMAAALPFLLFPAMLLAYQAAPFSQTTLATHLTEKSAMLHGVVSSNEMPDTVQWFEWGVSGRTDVVYETPHANIRGQEIITTANIIGLAPSTQYFYRQISENARGRHVGNTMYFTTRELPQVINPLIVVQTLSALSITENTAQLKGYVSPHGNRIAQWWFEWGTTNKLEHQTAPTLAGSDSRTIETNLRQLTPGTVYFYRLVGDNGEGRVYGATRVFVTLGTAPVTESPRAQNVPVPQEGSDGVTRNITNTEGAANGVQQNVFQQGLPGDYLGNFLRNRKKNAAEPTPTEGAAPATPEVQGATAPGPLARLFGAFSGGKGVVVTIEKVGSSKAGPHTPVEYKVMYAYRLNNPAGDARLKITLPPEVVYIGDNTTNELLLEEGEGPERTYVLPVARLEKGSTRTISILGMTTGDAKGFPDAYARIEFVGSDGKLQIIAAGEGVIDENTKAEQAENTAQVGASSNGILPSSFVGWLFYVALVAGAIFAARKAKAYYDQRKEELAEEALESESPQDTTKWLDEIRAHKNANSDFKNSLPT